MPVSTVEAGETITDLTGEEVELLAPCNEDAGNWVCLTHRKALGGFEAAVHNMEADQTHVHVWNCHMHGLEGELGRIGRSDVARESPR